VHHGGAGGFHHHQAGSLPGEAVPPWSACLIIRSLRPWDARFLCAFALAPPGYSTTAVLVRRWVSVPSVSSLFPWPLADSGNTRRKLTRPQFRGYTFPARHDDIRRRPARWRSWMRRRRRWVIYENCPPEAVFRIGRPPAGARSRASWRSSALDPKRQRAGKHEKSR
jgi:hypothetical protein